MKRKIALVLSLLILSVTSQYALARPHGGPGHGGGGHRGGGGWGHRGGGHHHSSSYIGFDFILGGPGYYSTPYYPYYPYPTTQTVVMQPSQYVERSVVPSENSQEDYWYYCSKPKGYYPYVKNCTVDWKKVQPFPNDAP